MTPNTSHRPVADKLLFKLSPNSACRNALQYGRFRGRRGLRQELREKACCLYAAANRADREEAYWDQQEQPQQPQKLRCALCYEPDFTNLTQLAEHLVGRRHSDLFPNGSMSVPCPYCSTELAQPAFYDHIRSGKCPRAGQIQLPKSQRRTLTQAKLDQDPSYAPIVEESIRHGVVRIRPMHMQHTFETALVITEAFMVDLDPPRFGWMLAELRRQALQYEADPSPVVQQAVNFWSRTSIPPPPVSDVVRETKGGGLSSLFPGPSMAEKRERQTREVEEAWGVWIWLVADLVPEDPSLLRDGQDSLIIGATAMMFHDRAAALERMQLMTPPLSAPALDYSLWLNSRPPPELEHKRAVFIWWTGVDSAFRRQGVARLLLRGCEAVGAAAGFWSFYLQASLRQRDRNSMLGAWLPREYNAAVKAYSKAGFTEYALGDKAGSLWSRTRTDSSAVLLSKSF